MSGGAGNDTYFVDDLNDKVFESAGAGTDTVKSSVSFSAVGQDIENITLISFGNVNATGNGENNVLTGNTGNNILDGGAGADTMAGGDGNDTYYVDNAGDMVIETIGQGTDTVYSSIDYVLGGQHVENVILTGSAVKAGGNGLDNMLTGNAGNNILNGNAGADTMAGGLGNDIYYVDNVGDKVIEAYNEGYDTVYSSIDFVLGGQYIEKVILTGSAVKAGGNGLNNYLVGDAVGNILNGNAGADTMQGGDGNDTYYVDNTGDVVIENAGQGTDLVYSSIDYTLTGNVENLTLTGTAIRAIGNNAGNVLTGTAAANWLNGLGGADTMIGGAGNDTYVVDNPGDVIIEANNGGTDTIRDSAVNYTMAGNTEVLVMLDGAVSATGVLNSTLYGNSAGNAFHVNAGGETILGGAGDDTYYFEGFAANIGEGAAGGNDVVYTNVNFGMGTAEIETVIVTSDTTVNVTGNQYNNTMTGGGGANWFDGGGGDDHLTGNGGNDTLEGDGGNDTMIGGTGDDTYYVDNIGDVVTENAGEGTDTVIAAISYTLLDNFENLTLIGSANINATGNAADNHITGNSGNNLIDGGAGADTMSGGGGSDTFIIDNPGDVVANTGGYGVVRENLASFDTAHISGVQTVYMLDGAISFTAGSASFTVYGNAADNVINSGTGYDTMAGGAGDDTYYIAGGIVNENVGEGNDIVYTSGNFTITSSVETVISAATTGITLTGAANADALIGGVGKDVLNGMAGADSMSGGQGNDTYYVDNTGDVVTENANEGTDTVISTVSYALGANVENLTLSGGGDFSGTGNDLANIITGNTGSNIIDGGAGADTMSGGGGNDVYYIDNPGDVVVEAQPYYGGGGDDTVYASVSVNFSAGNTAKIGSIEYIHLTGSDDINATGNTYTYSITGNSGDNILNGGGRAVIMGGDGNDLLENSSNSMAGGAGDDTYIIGDAADWEGIAADPAVTENANEGHDLVEAYDNYTLPDNVEDLLMLGNRYTDMPKDTTGTGNGLDNHITGDTTNNILHGMDGNDVIDGGQGNDSIYGDDGADFLQGGLGNDLLDGGAGADTMQGGDGNDTYHVDNSGDVVTENAGEGDDVIISSVSYSLADAPNIESLTLTGSDSLNATGGDGNDTLTGNDGNNVIDGGAGDDTMIGGYGNDTYYVDSSNDKIIEFANQGTNTVYASASIHMFDTGLDNVILTGSDNIDIVLTTDLSGFDGGEYPFIQDNTLIGNSGNNRLDGGLGHTTLTGGAGADTFVFSQTPINSSLFTDPYFVGDGTVTDFNPAEGDSLVLPSDFTITQVGADTVIHFDKYYDENGAGYTYGGTITLTGVDSTSQAFLDSIAGWSATASHGFVGTAGAETIIGTAAGEDFTGAAGNDTLTGAGGADTFHFSPGSGADTITDFSAANGDELDFNAYTHGTADTAAISQSGDDTVIDFGNGDTITLLNTTYNDPSLLSSIQW